MGCAMFLAGTHGTQVKVYAWQGKKARWQCGKSKQEGCMGWQKAHKGMGAAGMG